MIETSCYLFFGLLSGLCFYKFIKEYTNLLDLGSFPGGWTQVASQIITKGKIMSIDIKEMEPVKNVKFLKGNILEKQIKNEVIKYFNANLDFLCV